jgi:membrane fusion protein (multidrug efflux system)
MRGILTAGVLGAAALAAIGSGALAQMPGGGPPAVGVTIVEPRAITETTELRGRVEAMQKVDLIARVTGFLEKQTFEEGATVRKDQVLFELEKAPFEADVEAKEAGIARAQAQLENSNIALERAEQLLKNATGTQRTYDDALAAQKTATAALRTAQAELKQSQINLGYTEIRSPIDGRIGRVAIDPGNVVGPTAGILATVVSQDPMYVVFPMSVRRLLALRAEYASKGFSAVRLRLKLPDGSLYDQVGKLDFVDISVGRDTDSIILRGTIPNVNVKGGPLSLRELTNDEFVTVILEDIEPRKVIAVPRAAILSDMRGDYVFVVGSDNIARRRNVKLGQSTPEVASVEAGLEAGEKVVVDGIQRVADGRPVNPQMVSPTTSSTTPASSATRAAPSSKESGPPIPQAKPDRKSNPAPESKK